MAKFDGRKFSFLDVIALKNRLSDLLGVKVDLASAKFLKESIRAHVTREAALAFS